MRKTANSRLKPLVVAFLSVFLFAQLSIVTLGVEKGPGLISFGSESDWNSGSLRGMKINKGALRPTSGTRSAEFLSPWMGHKLDLVPFDRLIFSWNACTPPGTSIELKAQLRVGGNATSWVSTGRWSSNGNSGSKSTSTPSLIVAIDTIKVRSGKAVDFRFKIITKTDQGNQTPEIRRVFATYWRSDLGIDRYSAQTKEDYVDIPVPEESQFEEDPEISSRICSPTSLSMVLQYYGFKLNPTEVAEKVYDSGADIYGNWSFNTAFAGSLGPTSYVRYFRSASKLFEELKDGRPVIASIAFGKGELSGAPIEDTSGHLVVIRGFEQNNGKYRLIVNDPAAPSDSSVRREYDLKEFISAWRGIGYVIGSQEK